MSARSSAAQEIMSIKAVALRDAVRRALNIAGSVVLLALTLPLMVLVALAIKLESRGPVLYRQHRVGLHGRSFVMPIRQLTKTVLWTALVQTVCAPISRASNRLKAV